MTEVVEPAYLVGAGAAIGAILRYLTYEVVGVVELPFGTLAVNVLGSFVLGLVTFLGTGRGAFLFVGTGACGSYTTYSSFSFDVVRLWETGSRGHAVAFAALNLVGALLAIGLAGVLVGTL